MLGKTYDGQNCSAARALEVVGERWSLLILRDAIFRGCTRFGDFQRNIGLATNVLATRLESFLDSGLMQWREESREYVLTEKGRDMQAVVMALTQWGDRWAAPDGAPIIFKHERCGGRVREQSYCVKCGATPPATRITAHPRPGTHAANVCHVTSKRCSRRTAIEPL